MPLKTAIKITAVSVQPHRKVFADFHFSSSSQVRLWAIIFEKEVQDAGTLLWSALDRGHTLNGDTQTSLAEGFFSSCGG